MSNGVFVVAVIRLLRDGERIPLVSLIKMDHARVLEYLTEETAEGLVAKLQEVVNTFVEDKSALQKVALIDPHDHYAWDVLARERGSSEKLTDYFRGFLSVTEREDASYWTRQAISAVNSWAFDNELKLPDCQAPSTYKSRAISYMETHGQFTTDGFLDMVIVNNDLVMEEAEVEGIVTFRQSLQACLAATGVAGQTFAPKSGSVKRRGGHTKYVTHEGVTVLWEGDANTVGVSFEPAEEGRRRIIIETNGFSERQ